MPAWLTITTASERCLRWRFTLEELGGRRRHGPAKKAERAENRKTSMKWASDESRGFGQ